MILATSHPRGLTSHVGIWGCDTSYMLISSRDGRSTFASIKCFKWSALNASMVAVRRIQQVEDEYPSHHIAVIVREFNKWKMNILATTKINHTASKQVLKA